MPRVRSHLPQRAIVDSFGNVVTNASVRVLRPGTTSPITDSIYTTRSGVNVRSQPWIASDGVIDFYLDVPQRVRLGVTRPGGVETYSEDIDVGPVWGATITLKQWGAMGDGVTDDWPAVQDCVDNMKAGESRYCSDGVYVLSQTLRTPSVDGASLVAPPSSPVRLGAAVFRAKAGSNLTAIAAPAEWLNNGAGGKKDAQGVVVSGLSFDGNGFSAGSIHDTSIETTASTQYGLVVHGTGFKVKDFFINSANLDGLHVAGSVGADGSTVISETHEGWIGDGGIRYTGRDAWHAAPGAQDGYSGRIKVQYAGRHGFFTDDLTAAWDFDHNHPSRCGSDLFHHESGWEYNVSHNYLDSLGNFMDGVATPWRAAGAKRYGIFMNTGSGNCAHVQSNRMHTNTAGSAIQPIVGLYLKGWVVATDNTLIYQGSDSSVTMVENGGTPAWAVIRDNVAHTVT